MTTGPIVECVPNVSEGRDAARLARFAAAVRSVPGATLADVHADPDHHRSVFTVLGPPTAVVAAALALADVVVAQIDMREHRGIHPRIGALDVLPFVPLRGMSMAETVVLAHEAGRALAARHALPVYYYAEAARRPERRRLRELRHGGYEGLVARLASADGAPDDGPARFDPRAGAVLVAARDVLIAYNVWLAGDDLGAARTIARAVRASSGGLPAVQALGLPLASRGRVQVSMNLLDYRVTPIPVVFDRVGDEAERRGVAVERAELVGLAPRAAFARRAPASVGLAHLTPQSYLDTWLRQDG
ncbi:MAG TPA: glutamate formimidoyltransferase [Methylomirabilota bacterium]|nr:glutamate formimidoyltransferase [Methylomirabilota bacterium]